MALMKYGWKKDSHDERDHLFAKLNAAPEVLPPKISLRPGQLPVFDQGDLGSCTANALVGAFGFAHHGFLGSRLQLYWSERVLEHTEHEDSGAMLRDGIKVLAKTGLASEEEWPYLVENFAVQPPQGAYKSAASHRITSYQRLTPADYRHCLSMGHPFVIGFSVYENFESRQVAKTGIMSMPKGSFLGGHAVLVVGYDRNGPAGDCYEVRNSWGANWGDHGYFWMPASYLEDEKLANDAWTIKA